MRKKWGVLLKEKWFCKEEQKELLTTGPGHLPYIATSGNLGNSFGTGTYRYLTFFYDEDSWKAML